MKALSNDYFLTEPDEPGRGQTLDLERNPSVLLVWAANRFNRNASRYYQENFGITAMDWRMLVMLCKEPGASVTAASPATGYDKGAVSRSLRSLESLKLVRGHTAGTNSRNKQWYLTRKGQQLHDRVLQAAVQRQQELLDGMRPEEILMLNDLLQRFMNNLDRLET